MVGQTRLPSLAKVGARGWLDKKAMARQITLLAFLVGAVVPGTACNRHSDSSLAGKETQAASAPSYANLSPEQKRRITTYLARGRILGIDRGHHRVRIAHRDIPGFMQAMTMSFAVRDDKLLQGLRPGDAVEFTLETNVESTVIGVIRKVNSQ